MLETQTTKRIVEFVAAKPRTIQEIAHLVEKNWRTADRYVEQIAQETGVIATRTFREGTRGALKIVYHAGPEHAAATEVQERLLQKVLAGSRKEDFSPLDIYQYVPKAKRRAVLESTADGYVTTDKELFALFKTAQETILIFSGNLSWAKIKVGGVKITDLLAQRARAGVAIKIITRLDITTTDNLQRVQYINQELGRNALEIRHSAQPLRCTLVDGKVALLRETKSPAEYRKGELKEHTVIFYHISDEEWVSWLTKVFWTLFATGIPALARLEVLESIRAVKGKKLL